MPSVPFDLLVLLVWLFSQPVLSGLIPGDGVRLDPAVNTSIEHTVFSVTPYPSPGISGLESKGFIHQRQYPELYPPENLLPDLRSLYPADFRIVVDLSQDRQFLHFSTSFWNRGPGVLELLGREQADDPLLQVRQVVYRSDGTAVETSAGFFEYEGAHGHWHWENFSRYELWTVSETGLGQLVAANDKVGFCLRDVSTYRGDPSHVRLPAGQEAVRALEYESCSWELQGLSVGWSDIYRANIPGQFVEISGLPDGMYALKVTIDPADTIWETDETNNSALRYILLEGQQVQVMPVEYQPSYRSVEVQ